MRISNICLAMSWQRFLNHCPSPVLEIEDNWLVLLLILEFWKSADYSWYTICIWYTDLISPVFYYTMKPLSLILESVGESHFRAIINFFLKPRTLVFYESLGTKLFYWTRPLRSWESKRNQLVNTWDGWGLENSNFPCRDYQSIHVE